jgi:hypothetical protein
MGSIHSTTEKEKGDKNTEKQQIYEKMLNIIRHEGNTNQNYNKIPSHPS